MSRPGGATDTARRRSLGARAPAAALAPLAVLALTLALAGCGGSSGSGRAAPDATIATNCPATVLDTLGRVRARVYREGVASERTRCALRMISPRSRCAAPSKRATRARTRRRARAARDRAPDQPARHARRAQCSPTSAARRSRRCAGRSTAPRGKPIASFVDERVGRRGSSPRSTASPRASSRCASAGAASPARSRCPPGELARAGTLTRDGVAYQYTSFPARPIPSGPLRVYLLKPLDLDRRAVRRTSEGHAGQHARRIAG